jgi:hypothetical protein
MEVDEEGSAQKEITAVNAEKEKVIQSRSSSSKITTLST